MKHSCITIIAILFYGLLVSSCTKWSAQVEGIGVIITHTLKVDEFTKIRIEGADHIEITYGPVQKVNVTGHPNIISRIQTQVDDDTWNIALEHGNYGFYDLNYYITLPILEGVVISGSGNVTVSDSMAVEHMKISLIGSGSFFAFPLTTSYCDVDISGSGQCEVTVTNDLDVLIYGSGNVYCKGSPIIHEILTGSGRVICVHD